jgi:hypothetical protein
MRMFGVYIVKFQAGSFFSGAIKDRMADLEKSTQNAKVRRDKRNEIIDASAFFGPGGGLKPTHCPARLD